jgi:predicted O-methyltransferase YrrM
MTGDALAAYENYDDPLPELVQEAVSQSKLLGIAQMCLPDTGRFLQLLACHQGVGVIGETGTACGVGAAWMVSGMRPGARLVTVELDPERAGAAKRLFAGRDDVTVICGDGREIIKHGPFDLLFGDGGRVGLDACIDIMRQGGAIVKDDLTPESAWTDDMRKKYISAKADPTRRKYLDNKNLLAQEIILTPDSSVMLAIKL